MKISTNRDEYLVEFQDLAKLFDVSEEKDDNLSLFHEETYKEDVVQSNFIFVCGENKKEFSWTCRKDSSW